MTGCVPECSRFYLPLESFHCLVLLVYFIPNAPFSQLRERCLCGCVINAYVTETEATIWTKSEKLMFYIYCGKGRVGWTKHEPLTLSILDPWSFFPYAAWPSFKYPSTSGTEKDQGMARMIPKGPTHGKRCSPTPSAPTSSSQDLWSGQNCEEVERNTHFSKRKQGKAINKDRLVVYFVFFFK